MPLSEEFVAALTAFAAVVAASLGDRQLYERVEVARGEAEDERGKLQTILDVLPVGVVLLEGAEGTCHPRQPRCPGHGQHRLRAHRRRSERDQHDPPGLSPRRPSLPAL